MIFHSHANKTHLHKKGCALGLIFKVRVFGTRKCLIWRSFDPVWRFFFFYDLCFWSDCPPSWIIMSSVINWGSPPHKGRKLRWGSVADPGEGYPPPPPYLRVWMTAHTTPPPHPRPSLPYLKDWIRHWGSMPVNYAYFKTTVAWSCKKAFLWFLFLCVW